MNSMREQIRSLLTVESRENGFRAILDVDPDLPIFRDHFQDYPLLPGICLMQAVVIAGAIRQDVGELRVRAMKNAKMMQPVLPGDQLVIDAVMTPAANGDFLIKAQCFCKDKKCAEFTLVAGLDSNGEKTETVGIAGDHNEHH
jgi:3-hydroxymyristoyl/3-hydroxydecanoyl-(acyl carrier protein) dehydratase